MSGKFCTSCGSELDGNTKLCTVCGTPVPAGGEQLDGYLSAELANHDASIPIVPALSSAKSRRLPPWAVLVIGIGVIGLAVGIGYRLFGTNTADAGGGGTQASTPAATDSVTASSSATTASAATTKPGGGAPVISAGTPSAAPDAGNQVLPSAPTNTTWKIPGETYPGYNVWQTSATSDPFTGTILSQAISASSSSSALFTDGMWLESPRDRKNYKIQCEALGQYTRCLEVDNQDGGSLDAGIVFSRA